MERTKYHQTKIRVGHWNVRTMNETGKLAQVTSEMRRFKLHILGVSESRWTGSGKLTTATGETVIYSGSDLQYFDDCILVEKLYLIKAVFVRSF